MKKGLVIITFVVADIFWFGKSNRSFFYGKIKEQNFGPCLSIGRNAGEE